MPPYPLDLDLPSLLPSELLRNKLPLEVVHPPPLLELMLSIMELTLEDTVLLDGTLTTPTLLEPTLNTVKSNGLEQ